MAHLTKIAESLNIPISINDKQKSIIPENNKPEGRKRRDWITNEQPQQAGFLKEEKTQIINEKGRKTFLSLKDLRSNPLKVAQYIFESSQNLPDKTTNKTTRSEMMALLKLSKDSVKTAIRFLLRNFLIERIDFRSGKNGWSRFKVAANLFNEMELAYKNNFLSPQKTENKLLATLQQEAGWDNIDISQLEHIGLNKKHIWQLKSKSTPFVVQESIFHFAYGLKYNPKVKIYENPLSVLIGVLRKGEAWIEVNYRSAQEIAQESIIKNLQIQKERLEKLQEEAFNLAFSDWYNNLTPEAIEQTIQSVNCDASGQKNFAPKKVLLRTYFNKTVWSNKKHLYLSESN